MKTQFITLALVTLSLVSCQKKSNDPQPEEPQATTTGGTNTGTLTTGYTGSVNSSALNVYVIDTAKINTISETGTGETNILNHMINSSSYIMSFSNSPDGNKFVYSISQSNFSGPSPVYSKELRMANSNGSGDQLVYAVPGGTNYIGATRYGLNNKLYYIIQNFPGNDLYEVNANGTGNTKIFSWNNTVNDISVDGTYLLISNSNNTIQLVDRTGDGGAGSIYYTGSFSSAITNLGKGCLSLDNTKAFIPYEEAGSLKLRVIDLAGKTSVTKTIAAISGSWYVITAKVASDGDRIIVTVTNGSNSTSYNYKISTSTLTNSFTNNDQNVADVYPY